MLIGFFQLLVVKYQCLILDSEREREGSGFAAVKRHCGALVSTGKFKMKTAGAHLRLYGQFSIQGNSVVGPN